MLEVGSGFSVLDCTLQDGSIPHPGLQAAKKGQTKLKLGRRDKQEGSARRFRQTSRASGIDST